MAYYLSHISYDILAMAYELWLYMAQVEHRMDALLRTLRYLPGNPIILTGHSLFFRHMCQRFLPPVDEASAIDPAFKSASACPEKFPKIQ